MTQLEVGLAHPEESFEEPLTGQVVTRQRLVIDGDADKEFVDLDPKSGASSSAPSSTGIPSAVTQNRERTGDTYKPSAHTPMSGRVQPHETNHTP